MYRHKNVIVSNISDFYRSWLVVDGNVLQDKLFLSWLNPGHAELNEGIIAVD